MKRLLLLMAAAFVSVATLSAQQSDSVTSSETGALVAETANDAIVSSRFLPTSRRVDRNIDHNKFVYKGEVMLGLAASYGTLNASDADLMLLFDDIDFGLRRTTVKPFVAYAYRDNRSVGLRFGYEYINGSLGNIALNLGSAADLSFALSDVSMRNESFSWSLFHRNYMGLDRRGIVGAFIETELLFRTGTSSFVTGSGESVSASESRNLSARLNVNPGLAVYVFPQVCVTVTVGIGGLYYNQVRQEDVYGEVIGRRDRSGLKFKINIADIQIGIVAHLWNKKRN